MIRRRLSVPPERRIVRLPYTVGQVRLVGVPAVVGGCCIEDTFTEADPSAYIVLRDHTPETGGPWEHYGNAQPFGGGSYHPNWPQIVGGRAIIGKGEGGTWAHARVACASNVRVMAEYLMTDSTASGVASGVALRWSGTIESSVRAAIAVRLNRASPGNIGVWLTGGTTPDVGSFTLLGLIPYTGRPSITVDVSLVGFSLSWDAINNATGVRATKLRPTDTVKADYGAATGVGFWMQGIQYAAIYCGEFRACRL